MASVATSAMAAVCSVLIMGHLFIVKAMEGLYAENAGAIFC
jgi:hypothetical protein